MKENILKPNESMNLIFRKKWRFLESLKNPKRLCCSLFQNTSFFLQSQMDINPSSRWHNESFITSTGGYFPIGNKDNRKIFNIDAWDNTRRDMLTLLLRTIIENEVEGIMAEVGVYQGLTAKLIHNYLPERQLHLFDTFSGFTERGVAAEKAKTNSTISASHFADTFIDKVKDYISPQNNNVIFHPGYFPESIPNGFEDLRFSFVHLDADLHEPTLEGLRFFYPRMSNNGIIIVHDYNAWLGARKATDEFLADKTEIAIPMPDKSGSALIVKQ